MTRKLKKLIGVITTKYYLNALLKNHVAASIEHERIFDYLQSFKLLTIVDIGANRGQFVLAARHHFTDARIYSFEPLKEAADIYRRVFAEDTLTNLYEIAIGPEETEITIHVSKADDSSSLLPISSLQNELYPGTSEKESRSIIQKPLEAILKPSDIQSPAFLKIDVQGYEKQVLEGCKSLLPLFTYTYIECSFVELYVGQALAHEIISFLSNYGFILSGVYNLDNDKKGIPIQGDFLFTRK